ncbi:hypothetical protein BX616_003080 [Lobosporangium transversale]|nr:hypothetical protein BX616_003080 [Lobosporangium transversale]
MAAPTPSNAVDSVHEARGDHESTSVVSTPPVSNQTNITTGSDAPCHDSISSPASPKRLINTTVTFTINHRRNQSHGHMSFPTLTMPSTPTFTAFNSTAYDTPRNPLSAAARSSSVPTTPGQVHIHHSVPPNSISSNRSSATGLSVAAPEKETYTLSDRTSILVQTTGQVPPSLIGSASVIYNGHMYLFGGRPIGKDPTNDLYVLNLDTLVWTLMDQQRQQSLHRQRMIDRSDDSEGDDQQQSPPSEDRMQTPHVQLSEDPSPELNTIDSSSSIPSPRYCHSAVLVVAPPLLDINGSLIGWGGEDTAHMIIFGGRCLSKNSDETKDNAINDSETCLNDTHILDLNTLQWIPSSLSSGFNSPSSTNLAISTDTEESQRQKQSRENSRRGSMDQLSFVSDDVFSESFIHLRSQEDQSPTNRSRQHDPYRHYTPAARFAHVASLTGDRMVIVGGRGSNNEQLQDICVLDLKTHIWMAGGEFQGQPSYGRSALASVEERPMTRRRRRYLECLAAESMSLQSRPSSTVSSSSSLTHQSLSASGPSPYGQLSTTPVSPSAMLNPLLNPRKNSWHRGEGHPFELNTMSPDQRQRLKSDADLLSTITQDDGVWRRVSKSPSASTEQMTGSSTMLSVEDALYRVPYNSDASKSKTMLTTLQTTTSSNSSSISSGSRDSRARSNSIVHSIASSSHTLSSNKYTRANTSQGSITHAVPKKFFSKSSSSLFDLDNLATTIARDQKVPPSPRGKDSFTSVSPSRERTPNIRRSNSNSASSTSSRRSSGFIDDSKSGRRVWRDVDDDKSDKRRSLDSVLDSVSLSGNSAEDRNSDLTTVSRSIAVPYSQPLYYYSNYTTTENKPKREFFKVQTAKGPYRPFSSKVVFDIRPEWTALDLGSGMLGGPDGLVPPKMLFPVAQIVDHYFLLSGASIEEDGHTKSQEQASSSAPTSNVSGRHFTGSSTSLPSSSRRHTFSVWMHHFHNHQWTQLELSKNLRTGEWSHSVLDRQNNYLYIFGRRTSDSNEEESYIKAPRVDDTDPETDFSSSATVASYSHLIKVDLEGLEICPDVDESSIGPSGVKMGLEMLRDGVGADVVLVSSADGGRVRVNSGIVGQRWGYFQALMEERERIWKMEVNERLAKKASEAADPPGDQDNLTSKQWYLDDRPAEILVRESTPLLVGFLQYLYTNELSTPHQLKLKTLQGLLLIAHFYDLTRLQQLVRQALYQQLNANNAPAICEIAVLTHEFGLQTRALRTILQSARLVQLRRQGEAAEAKRRLDFAMSRLEEIEEDRKRKASMHASQLLLQQSQAMHHHGSNNPSSMTGGSSISMLRGGSAVSSAAGSGTSTPGLSTIGRFFRHREESSESIGPVV